jgi:hypothetical protein
MVVNRMVVKELYQPSERPYHLRVADIGTDCMYLSKKACLDKYEKQVYETVATIAHDYYEAVMYHEHMEAPLPF